MAWFTVATKTPALAAALRDSLEPCGKDIEELRVAELTQFAASQQFGYGSVEIKNLPPPPYIARRRFSQLIVELEQRQEFDTLVDTLFGGAEHVPHPSPSSFPTGTADSPFPRLLIPTTEPKSVDELTVVGERHPVEYVRWQLANVNAECVLAGYDLFEPMDGWFIDLLQTGAAILRVNHWARSVAATPDCERLATLAEDAIVAAQYDPDTWEPLCLQAINRMHRLRDDFLVRAAVLGLAYGLSRAYQQPWWRAVEAIDCAPVAATLEAKQDWCEGAAMGAWTRICQRLTRVDRLLYDRKGELIAPIRAEAAPRVLNEFTQAIEAVCPDPSSSLKTEGRTPRVMHEPRLRFAMGGDVPDLVVPPPSSRTILEASCRIAREKCPDLFAVLKTYRPMPGLETNRSILEARCIDKGYLLLFHVSSGRPPGNATVEESPVEKRKTRILFPLMRKMHDDIEANVPLKDCGWLEYRKIDGGLKEKKTEKFRRDESDLNKDLESIKLKTETDSQGKRIRLSESLAMLRTIIRGYEG